MAKESATMAPVHRVGRVAADPVAEEGSPIVGFDDLIAFV
jgi:hypothetical protein